LLPADPGPIARLESVKAADTTPGVIFSRLTEGESLKEIARAWQVPAGRFTEWFTTQHAELYDAALKVCADQDAHETVKLADEAPVEDSPKTKLQIDARKWRSGKYDRERYGDRTDVKHSGLVPTLTIEIVGVPQAPQERVIEHETAKIEDGIV